MSVKVLPAMLFILLLCRALLAAEVQSLSIDAQLGTSIEDCFERISIGEHVSPSAIYRNVSELTTKECEQLCKQDRQCQTYDYGVGAKGNATCNLSNQSEKELKERNLLVKDPDYDVYVRRFQCEQSPPSPLKPLLDEPGEGPTHRPVFRPEIDEPKRPLADFPISQGFGQYPYDRPGYPPPRPIQPPFNNHLDERPDDYTNTKPDYDKPPSYGLHRPQEIPYRPNQPYRPGSYDVLQFQGQYGKPPQNPNWRPDPSYPPQSGDDIQDIYGVKPIRPKPDLPAYRPEEKPQYQYVTRPNRIPRPPEEGGYNKPKPEDYRPDPYGPSNTYKPNYEYPSRPYEKPSYSYNNQYASQYGQNHNSDTSIYLEIYDPHRPYKPNNRPAYGGGSSGYSPSYGYSPGTSEYGGSYTNQNSYNQMQSQSHYYGTGVGTITQLDNYNRPAIDYKPQKPAQSSGYGGQSQQIDQSYGGTSGSGGYGPPKPSGSYNKPESQGSYGGNQGYGTSPESTYGGQSSHSGYGSSSSQGSSQASYGVTVKPTYGQASYDQSTQYGQGSYQSNRPITDRPSYGSEPSYDNRPTHSKPGYGNKPNYDDRPSYGNKPSYGDGPSYDNTPSYDRPSNTKPSYTYNVSYESTSNYGDIPSYGNKPSYNERPINKPSSGYGEPSTDDLPSYGTKPGYVDRPTSTKPSYNEPSYGNKPNYDRPSYGNKPSYEDRPPYGNKPDYDRPSYDRPPYEEPGYGNKPQPQPAYNEPSYNRPNKPYDDNRPDGDPGPAYGEIGPSYGSTPKPSYQPPSYGTEDYKNTYNNNQSNYWPSVKPVYEHEMERPHNVPSYIVRPGGEVVTSKPVAIGDYGGKPAYGREPVSYRACFRRVLAGHRALRSFVRRVVPCEALEDCRRECATERRFHCESFNYRMDLAFRAKGLCEMMTKPIEAFDLRRDFVEDKDYDFFEVDRNSLEPHCPETLRGPGHLHSGYLTSKPTRVEHESGWQRNNWHRGRFVEDQDRRDTGSGRFEDQFFVPYQIGVARSDNADAENFGGYGGGYGGGVYYKNRNDYHKSISHWGINDIKPWGSDHGVSPTIRPNFNYNDLGRNGWTENKYGFGAWKKGRWNTSGSGWSGLDYGESRHYKPPQNNIYLEVIDRSNSEDELVQDCSSKRRPGMSLGSGAIRRALFARNVVECEAACFNEREFKCVSYSYRYSNAHNSDNCFLSERPYRGLQMAPDSGSDVYAMPQHQGCSAVSKKPWIESECFWHVRSGTAIGGNAVRAALTVAGLGACEAECIRAHAFFCRGFSFRFDPPRNGDDQQNCILTASPTTSLENGHGLRPSAGHELYSRGNYGRGCEPALNDDLVRKESGECYLQYDNAAKLTSGAVRGAARANNEQACAAACTNAPFRCLSFSYTNNAPPNVDNCLLSDVRYYDLQRGVDYQHSTDDWLFAFDLLNGQCWRKVHGKGEEPVQEYPHPIPPQSGPTGPQYLPAPPVATYPSGPVSCGNCGPESKPHPAGPVYLPLDPPGYPVPSGPDYNPNSGFRPGYPYPDSGFKPGFPPPDSGFKPAYPDIGHRPGGPVYLPAPSGPSYGSPGSGPGYPGPQPVDREEPMKSSWRHYTVSGLPCRKGTTCAQNQVAGHWACEPEGGEIGSWDYCCAPSHRCGYSEGFHKPWCYVGQSQDQWRPCSEKYYPYHQHNVPHPSQGHGQNRPFNRPDHRPDHRPDGPVPGQYLSEADRRYWDQLYQNGPQAYYDNFGNPLPGYSRVPMSNRPHITYHHTDPPSGSGWVRVPSPEGEQHPPMPGGLGVPRYWPVSYLHKGPPPNITYFRYNETDAPTTTQRYDYRPVAPPRDPPPVQFIKTDPDKPNGNNIDNNKNHRDEKNRNIKNATEDVFQIDLSKVDKTTTTTVKPQIKETSTEPIIVVQKEKPENKRVQVEVPKPESVKVETDLDKIEGVDGKISDFGSIEVLDIKDAEKGDKISDLKTLEAEERQIEAIGRLLASRRGGQLVLEKRSQKDLETKSIAVDKEATEFDFGNKYPNAERRGKVQRVTKDDIEKERNVDKSLEVSETTFVRPPRVLSTTENIRKAIFNGKVFYDATIREQRDIFSNSTRKTKSFRPLEDSRAPSIFQNATYGKKKTVRARNVVNPVRKVRRVYRRKYNPDEVRRRLLDREKNAKEQRELMSNKKFQ